MIQVLAEKYPRHIASALIFVFTLSFSPIYGSTVYGRSASRLSEEVYRNHPAHKNQFSPSFLPEGNIPTLSRQASVGKVDKKSIPSASLKAAIGGPSQPEMSSFKAAGTDNMVNLFTGDFNYNIPLLDVGGYPVNLFYDGGITMEQEASWVGLGWNINPGTVSRNMRGVPDDFNGKDDKLKQVQKMKPNNTWGFTLGADLELVGVDFLENIASGTVGASLGYSYNNYLGPALDLGVKGTTNIKLAGKAGSEKSLSLGAGIGANVNSRNGVTLSPNLSLSANAFANVKGLTAGVGIGTTYNSRSGIKQLQMYEQMSYNVKTASTAANYYANKLTSHRINTPITFAKPTYIPAIRMPITNKSGSGRFELGGGMFGVKGSLEADAYIQQSRVDQRDEEQEKSLAGYLYAQDARDNPNVVMDFTRLNDNEVTPKTPIISAPQYAYDVFSIQGEGTGGSIRAFRNDLGYVRDVTTRSRDESFSGGADIAPGGHFGANFDQVKTPSYIGDWRVGNKIKTSDALKFQSSASEAGSEHVYFRNPGETTVLSDRQFEDIGGTDLVRFKLGGTDANPTVEPVLEQFSKLNILKGTKTIPAPKMDRRKRSQVISFLTAEEAKKIGLDDVIYSYNPNTPLSSGNLLNKEGLPRYYEDADINLTEGKVQRKHHISQINVTESDGRRYVYGVPVYNIIQKDYSFTVKDQDKDADLIAFDKGETTVQSHWVDPSSKKDGFVQMTQTPAYAHSFLLSGLLSPDYVDVTGNGISEDDLGDAVKFNYTKSGIHKWSTPFAGKGKNLANFNGGHRFEVKDDKALFTYGERESWYLHSIESKTMIALFTLEERKDGKGLKGEFEEDVQNPENGMINRLDGSQKRLKKIDLYNKADLNKNGMNARPVKTVWFTYNYNLCGSSKNNNGEPEMVGGRNVNLKEGKLSLESVYFTFNGGSKAIKSKYTFSYGTNTSANPSYTPSSSDKWGNYKPEASNPTYIKNGNNTPLKNAVYPYSIQNKDEANRNAGAWGLKTIFLPSGGQIEVEYESDDYAFVQNKRAAVMMQVHGLGRTNNFSNRTNSLYSIVGAGTNSEIVEHDYVFIKVPEAIPTLDNNGSLIDPAKVKELARLKYLQGLEQLAFKLSVNMPKGDEYINCYAIIDPGQFGVCAAPNNNILWVKMKEVSNVGPLSLGALEYLRERLPGQAFKAYDLSESTGLKQVAQLIQGLASSMSLKDPVKKLRQEGKAKTINLDRSYVRLNEPGGHKYGGGHRVKSIRMKDNWDKMAQQYPSVYGQAYDYTTTEVFNGTERIISSGVASYEPSIGGEENPFQTIVQVSNNLPLGPASYSAIEMPILDAFFPAPLVGYSKVTVKSIGKGDFDKNRYKSRSGIGKQVTEFYTARDFPVSYSHTSLDPASSKDYHEASLFDFFYKYAIDSRAISQGFLVETNDMHGKLKSQASFAEGDEKTPVNYTENFYSNTGSKGLEQKFNFVYASEGGKIREGNMGIDIELMTDIREFSVKSISEHLQAQVDQIVPPFVWLPFIWEVDGNSENTYRAVTTTKVVNYHGVLTKVVVVDKGSMVRTENLVYDAETGNVVVNKTNNEFDEDVYNVNYPAYWAYSGMGPAYKNIEAERSGLEFKDGKIVGGMTSDQIAATFESGDELYIKESESSESCQAAFSGVADKSIIWAYDKNKNMSSLSNIAPDFIFMDKAGKLITRKNVLFNIVRSGKRNMLSASVSGVTTLSNPVVISGSEKRLTVSAASLVVDASAVEFREKWQIDNDVVGRFAMVQQPGGCMSEQINCSGYLEKSINPYVKGLLGNFRIYRNRVFYGSRTGAALENAPLVKEHGFLTPFKLFWDFNTANNLVPDLSNGKWVMKSQATRVNSRGIELETKDALNVYTAAQYAYKKNLPVAIANDCRNSEMFFTGFEDNGYDGNLHAPLSGSCFKPHLDLLPMGSLSSENAHSGRSSLAVSPGTSSKSIRIASADAEAEHFDLTLQEDITSELHEQGVRIDEAYSIPEFARGSTTQKAFGYLALTADPSNFGLSLSDEPTDHSFDGTAPNCVKSHENAITTTQYFKVEQDGTYNFTVYAICYNGNSSTYETAQISVKFFDAAGNFLFEANHSYAWPETTKLSRSMCKGIYKVETRVNIVYYAPNPTCNWVYDQMPTVNFYLVTNIPSLSYSSLSQVNGCHYTKPLPATEGMLNPVFTIPSGKKMFFSAWVKQNCGNAPCSNKVRVDFGGESTDVFDITPSGPVIEGWQRVEGHFTAPVNATTANLRFVNNSSQIIYFDDVRIHPFNANMKSYVYDPVNLRLTAELDANNFATYYEYDAEGTLVRTKAETKEGVKTLKETRSFRQEMITPPVE
ncbi:hypothetical protein V9K67_24435 [Paraflavisolibacter sp. H34]|uniref:hypothetical protein n=1 Tax=Huijunlia imazamoxiresistens TaxID=3127457 RepID=UPI00301B2293